MRREENISNRVKEKERAVKRKKEKAKENENQSSAVVDRTFSL